MDEQYYKQIVTIMEKVQQTSSCHQKYQIILFKLYKESHWQDFYKYFEKILVTVLNQDPKTKNIYAERALDFCALFCTVREFINVDYSDQTEDCSLFEKVFNFLLDLHNLESDVVRYRVCQIIDKILNNLTDTELDGDLCDKIEKTMLERIKGDSKSEVRFQAVSAVYHLQNPDDPECMIIPVMILHMSGDPSVKVRKICVQKIGIQRDVLVALVTRTRDVSADVRLAAYIRLSKLSKNLKISEKQTVIRNGFSDTCEQIKKFVMTQLVPAWLSDYDNNYLKLLKVMRLDSTDYCTEKSTTVIKYVLRTLFSCRPIEESLEVLKMDNTRTLAHEDLTWESVLYWQYLIEALRKSEKFELHLNTVLPDLVDFAKYIHNYYNLKSLEERNTPEFQFILNQLFIITQGYDLSDIASRQVLNALISRILQEVELTTKVATTIIETLRKSIPKIEAREQFVCEIISDIMYPTCDDEKNIRKTNEATFKVAQMKVQLYCLNDQLSTAVQEEDFQAAVRYKEEIKQLDESVKEIETTLKDSQVVVKKTDVATILKCLNITRGLLFSKEIKTLSPTLRSLCDNLIMEQLTANHLNNEIRAKALECYALCCIVDEKSSEKGIHIFSTYVFASTTKEENYIDFDCLLVAIKGTVDLLILYGQTLIKPPENEGEFAIISLTNIIQALVDLMDEDNLDIQECATTGLCKLILYGGVQSSSLISRMILKWCNPVSGLEEEGTQRIRQTIGMMLEELPKLNGSSEQMENAVLPTIKTLLKAPRTSPLSEVNIQDIIKFLLVMCSLCEETMNIHLNLAVLICWEIQEDPTHVFNVTLSKMLLMLNLSSDDRGSLRELLKVCDELRDDVRNRNVLNNITKFVAYLDTLITHNVSVINEELEE